MASPAAEKKLIEAARKAHAEAKEIIEKEDVDLVDPRAEEALEAAIEIVRAKAVDPQKGREDYLYTAGDRLKAAKVVLEFTKPKPAAKNEITINRAEDFLEAPATEGA